VLPTTGTVNATGHAAHSVSSYFFLFQPNKGLTTMNVVILGPLLSLLCGIAILVWPRLLNYIVAFYLILFGVLGLAMESSFFGMM
jgi:hypothetical protein